MAHAHAHSSADLAPASPRARRMLLVLLTPFLLATLAGLVILWPDEVRPDLSSELGAPDALYDARVVEVGRISCPGPGAEDATCVTPVVELLDGPDAGELVDLQAQSEAEDFVWEEGTTIVVSYLAAAAPEHRYAFADLERRTPLYLLAALFAAAVVLLGRWQGLRALVGLGLSLLVLTSFVLPAVLDGRDTLAVALVGASVIAFVSLYLAHGLNARTTTALLGSLASLAVVGVLGTIFVAATRITGMADEDAFLLTISAADIDLTGLVLGGLVIGALGVLDDVTVTQASAVWELHHANPRYTRWDLYRSAVRIGRDHIASTVNTLVLAYAGVSLPLFLIFMQGNVGLLDAINGETVAVEIVRTLCGSIGLVASVPLTTALAALVVVGPAPGGWRASAADAEPGEGEGDGEGDDEEPVPAADGSGGDGGAVTGAAAAPVGDDDPPVAEAVADDDGVAPDVGEGDGDGDERGDAEVGGNATVPSADDPVPDVRTAPADPRRFRSRRERQFWDDEG